MFHKIKSVTPLPDYILTVQFSEGVTKRYNLNILIERYPMFSPLKEGLIKILLFSVKFSVVFNNFFISFPSTIYCTLL